MKAIRPTANGFVSKGEDPAVANYLFDLPGRACDTKASGFFNQT